MPVRPARSAQASVGPVALRRPRRRIGRHLVVLRRIDRVHPEVRELAGRVAAPRLADTGDVVETRHGDVSARPAVRDDEALGVDLADRGDEHAADVLVLFHRAQLARRFVDQVEEQFFAGNVLVPARQHLPVEDGGTKTVWIGVDVARLRVGPRDAVLAGNPVEADHSDDSVLARKCDALVERLEASFVDNLPVLRLAVLHPAAVVERHADEVESPLLHPLEVLFLEADSGADPAHTLQVEAVRRERRLPVCRRPVVILLRNDRQNSRCGYSCHNGKKVGNFHRMVVYQICAQFDL